MPQCTSPRTIIKVKKEIFNDFIPKIICRKIHVKRDYYVVYNRKQ
jgi:hypothetical protein